MITEADLDALRQHWAISALQPGTLETVEEAARFRLVRTALAQFGLGEDDTEAVDSAVKQAITAYEVAAAEGLDSLLHPSDNEESARLQAQAQAAAFKLFEYARALPIDQDTDARVFQVLHMLAVAYCGDRWAECRRWIRQHEDQIVVDVGADTPWEKRVLYCVFACWIRLVRKAGWDDLSGIADAIIGLRAEQARWESSRLASSESDSERIGTAYHLVSMYHWARATELVALYMLQGQPSGVNEELDKHFEAARHAAVAAGDSTLDMVLCWLHVASRRMVAGSLWSVAQAVNSQVARFVANATKKRSMFEFLPPQRVALQRAGLLDPAKRAIVVDMPTSGGKTALAEFRILQALNQFDADGGWVAYVAPTRALVSQLSRRLRGDLGVLGIVVQQLSGALDLDSFEESLLSAQQNKDTFHVLVCTPEKLQVVIRNNKTPRPLALLVLDEAHNLEDPERGLRIELLLATVRRECPSTSFMLLTPFVPNGSDLAKWLAPDSGTTISLSTAAWQPNDRLIGTFAIAPEPGRGDWSLQYEALTTPPRSIHLHGTYRVGSVRPLPVPKSCAESLSVQAGAIAKVMSVRGTSVAVARTIRDAWSMARVVSAGLEPLDPVPEEIALVQRFLATEVSPSFELIPLLSLGVGVHHAGLSDETRSLIEWLTEIGRIRVLCATTTIAQGMNFPVSSVFLASRFLPLKGSVEMPSRDFWNLAGRAGRFDQDSVGVVGIAAGDDREAVKNYVSRQTGALLSRLQRLLDDLYERGALGQLEQAINADEWADFRGYIAHLWNEKRSLDLVLGDTEQVLRNTYGYTALQQKGDPKSVQQMQCLLDATRRYVVRLSEHPENAVLSDSTGFAPEGVRAAILGLRDLGTRLTYDDWSPNTLFGNAETRKLADLFGVMLKVPELRNHLQEIGGQGLTEERIALLTKGWVAGQSLENLAIEFFEGNPNNQERLTDALSATCRAIYRTITNFGTWGMASLPKLPTSGLDFDRLTAEQKRLIGNLPAMVYYGVHTEPAILMRMQAVPRSTAERLGQAYIRTGGAIDQAESQQNARRFVESMSAADWERVRPDGAQMSGEDYLRVWSWLSGKST